MQLFPPPPAPKQPPAAAAPDKGKAEKKAAAPAGDLKNVEADKNEPPAATQPQPPVVAGGLPAVAPGNVPTQYVALGSLDPNSGYRMLVTLTSTGAAVARAEMTSPRYRDQHDWSGYLGDLELKNVAGGVQVQVVGAGLGIGEGKHPHALEAEARGVGARQVIRLVGGGLFQVGPRF